MGSTTTAILAFVREPSREAQAKPLWGRKGGRRNAFLFRRLNQRLRSLARRSGLPLIWLDESKQEGTTFGERLTAGIEYGFNAGYDRLIVVGNDCPDLRVNHLLAAEQALDHHSWVIGPDHHGGSYLIGIRQPAFNASYFRDLPWQTDALLTALQGQFASTNDICFLSPERDINTHDDLRTVLNSLQTGHLLLRLLRRAFAPLKRIQFRFSIPLSELLHSPVGLRAPPLSC